MRTFVILATGQSLTAADVDYVRGKATIIAVSNAYTLAPWADMLVSKDRTWWLHNPDAFLFPGGKHSYHGDRSLNETRPMGMPVGCNSGLYAMFMARDLGAERIILLGFDMQGTHFFGPHPAPLKNSNDKIFRDHLNQFKYWKGPEVINCTPGSALTKFPYQPLREVL